jgi:beta-lactam-binding protein with PASTA domain
VDEEALGDVMHGFAVFMTALVTAIATSVATVYVVDKYDLLHAKSADTVVPDFRGLSENDARGNAAVAHIALLIASREPEPSAKPGTVVRQSTQPGQRVPHEYSMSVVIAEEVPKVPKVVGMTAQAAQKALEQSGYTADLVESSNEVVEKGFVFDQTPKADEPLAKGKAVSVEVSRGPVEIELPKLIGMRVAQAQTDLEKLGLKVLVRWMSIGETPINVVLNQTPAAGEKVKPGATVQLSACR